MFDNELVMLVVILFILAQAPKEKLCASEQHLS